MTTDVQHTCIGTGADCVWPFALSSHSVGIEIGTKCSRIRCLYHRPRLPTTYGNRLSKTNKLSLCPVPRHWISDISYTFMNFEIPRVKSKENEKGSLGGQSLPNLLCQTIDWRWSTLLLSRFAASLEPFSWVAPRSAGRRSLRHAFRKGTHDNPQGIKSLSARRC